MACSTQIKTGKNDNLSCACLEFQAKPITHALFECENKLFALIGGEKEPIVIHGGSQWKFEQTCINEFLLHLKKLIGFILG
jgi:hypothetical protein